MFFISEHHPSLLLTHVHQQAAMKITLCKENTDVLEQVRVVWVSTWSRATLQSWYSSELVIGLPAVL